MVFCKGLPTVRLAPTTDPVGGVAYSYSVRRHVKQRNRTKLSSISDSNRVIINAPDELDEIKEDYDSPLPPFKRRKTEVVHHADICLGLWTFNQPWTPVPFNNTSAGIRMIVFKLDDGSLWVNNPVAPTGEVLEALEALNAPVKHIVISSNSLEHWIYAEKFAELFPTAKVWAPPGFFEGKRILGNVPGFSIGTLTGDVLGDEPPPDWKGQIDHAVFQTDIVVEIALLLRHQRVLLLTDTGFRIDETCGLPLLDTWIARIIGLWNKIGSPLWPLYLLNRQATKSFAQKVLGWDFDVLLAGHMACPVRNAKPQIQELFRTFV
eukprot:jgi/Botrbrau1/4167/Bobra.0192s0034.1